MMMRYKGLYERKFEIRQILLSLRFGEGNTVEIKPDRMSRTDMIELKNGLVYDGYALGGEVDGKRIVLTDIDDYMCTFGDMEEAIRSRLEAMNYEPELVP